MNSTISATETKKTLSSLFEAAKVPKSVYKEVVRGLVETSLRGVDSHGIRLAPHYVRAALNGRINISPKITIEQTSTTTAMIDADHTYGLTAGVQAMKHAIKLSSKHGTGVAVVKNSSHFGAAGVYTLMAARENKIGLGFTSVDSLVIPHAGTEPFLGTNPIAFAVPCAGEDPFCLDMATTRISWNKVRMHKQNNEPLPLGTAVDKDGKVTTDPKKAESLKPMGEYKGYGLGLMVEILSSVLTGMPFGSLIPHMFPLNSEKRYLGHFFMAIDPEKFQSIDVFKKRMTEMMEMLRSQKPSEGYDQVMVPGDPEKIMKKKRKKEGIPLSQEMIEDFKSIAKELKVDLPNNFK
jgi:ureidoglycolate dehydrogenase (NAD+)